MFVRWLQSLHPRTQKIGRNVLASMVYRVVSMGASLVMVPLLLDWLGATEYGVWLTIQAVVGWFMIFDLGLGNGMRNKVAEALAVKDFELARTYVSTAYALISAIALGLFFLFLLFHLWIDWTAVFNTGPALASDLKIAMVIVFAFFSIQFVFQLVKMLFMADQRPSVSALVNTVGTVLSLAVVASVYKFFPGSLVTVALIVSGTNIVVLIGATVWAFNGKYRSLKPTWTLVSKSHLRGLTTVGIQFFVLQGAALVVFATDNMIITQMIGPDEVPAYNIAFKYFNLVMVFFTLLTVPYWSAFTEAWQQNDTAWIKSAVRSLMRIWGGTVVMVGLMLLLAPAVYQLWVGDRVEVSLGLSVVFAIWVSLSSGVAVFSNFLSGVGKINLSLYHAVFVTVVNIPLSIWLAGPCGMGSTGVILASVLGMIPRVVMQPVQYYLLITGKAHGIWNR